MRQEAIKLELIAWLSKLEDAETINYLKVVKESNKPGKDWWHDLTTTQKKGIGRGLKDIDAGRVVAHSDVRKKYGL